MFFACCLSFSGIGAFLPVRVFFFLNGPVPISYLTHHQTHFASQRSNETKITLAICPPDEDNPHQGDSVMGAGECAAAAAAAGG
jgi:hypothetical protein